MLFDHGLFGLLWRTAIGKAQAPAVALGKYTTHTYAELLARSARLSGGLQKIGCRRGDRVAVFMKNDPAWLEILFGMLACRPRRGAGQRQAACARARVHTARLQR